jgi:hypothetical protein
MITTEQMAELLIKRQAIDSSSSLGEIVLLKEILATLSLSDPLRPKIEALFEGGSEASHACAADYDRVLAEARRRMI